MVRIRPMSILTVSSILLGLLSVILCFVPLFNLLAFEFCLAATCALTLVHGVASAYKLRDTELTVVKRWQLSCLYLLGPCIAMLVPILANGIFVRNCNWWEGFQLFALLVIGGGIVSSGFAAGCAAISKRGHWFFVGIWLLAAAVAVGRFLLSPQVDVFTLFGGYFPGALYDEVIQQQERILWSRFEDLWLTTSFVFIVAIKRGEFRKRTLIWLISIGGLVYLQSHRLDLRRSHSHIQMRLGGHLQTAHFQLYFPKTWSNEKASKLGVEMEFLREEVTSALQTSSDQDLGIYFYANMNQKKRLMGARNTRIAKPWQKEFHIDSPRIGASVIRHELIHLIAAEFGASPLKIAQNRFGLPNMALTEGLAEAHSPRDSRLSLHEWSAALGRINKRPNIESLMSADGFYQSSARIAYTVCGSLLLYTEQKYGLDAVKAWYRSGQWQREPELSELLTNWAQFLEAVPLSPQALEATKAYFDRPSIFKRVCAHELSHIREKAHRAIRLQQRETAFRLLESILLISPKNKWARLAYLEQLALDGQLEAALQMARDIGQDEQVSKLTRNIGQEWEADINVLKGDLITAQSAYETLGTSSFDRNVKRRIDVKSAAMKQPELAKDVVKLLSFSQDAQQARDRLQSLFRTHPQNPIIGYLKARHHLNRSQREYAARLLAELKVEKLPQTVQMEISRLRAHLAFEGHCFHLAETGFAHHVKLYGSMLTAGERDRFDEWRRRSGFFARSKALKHLSCPLEIDNLYIRPHDDGHQE